MKNRVLLLGVFSILRAGMAADIDHPQVITLADGTRLTLLGTTQGTRHYAPHFENLPTGNWLYTPSNAAILCIETDHAQGRLPIYEVLVYGTVVGAGKPPYVGGTVMPPTTVNIIRKQ